MANLSSVEFEGVKCSTVYIQESNELSTDANENTNALGLFVNPSINVPGRPVDITGYSLVSANSQGKLEWANPSIFADAKQPVRAASTTDIDLSSIVSIVDDVPLNDEDRVLVKDQIDTTENGIYELENGFLIRTTDTELGSVATGAYVLSTEGTINFDTLWVCSTYESIFGDPINFDPLRVSTSSILPPSLVSIGNLTTFPNEMIYTIAADTYATTALTVVGRSLLLQPTVLEQRSQLGLEIGSDVQAYSSILDDIVAIPNTNDRMLYTVGGSYSGTPVTAFIRANVLPAPDAATLSSNLGYIVGPVSTTNRILKVSGSNTVSETGLSIDASNNLTGVNNVNTDGNVIVDGLITSTDTINGVTPLEFTQLANIDSTTISTAQWGFLGSMNQGVATTNTPTFNGLSAGSQKITALATPTNAQDAANKTYVDTVASTGAAPLNSSKYATAAVLPNTPTYASPGETITSTGAPGSLTIDGQTMSVGDRVLIKDQADNRENGVYDVTDDGATPGPNWVLTRASDFNQAATPISVGTSIFVEIVSGASQSGSTWSLQTTVNTIDPLTDAVTWVQIGGSPSFTAGLGIDATQLSGGTIQTDISARLTYSGNDLDLNTVTVPFGGTGLTAITSGNVMIGQGTAAVSATKAAPTGNFVGTSDTQTLTNKTMSDSTNDVTSRGLFTNSGTNTVSTFAAANPTSGQVLTSTGATTATWQSPSSGLPTYTNTLTVSPSNPDVSPNWTTLGAAITDAISLVPTETNQVLIIMYPGIYTETTPLTIPEWISISGQTSSQGVVVVRPIAPATVGAVLVLNGNVRLYGFVIEGFDGAAANATIGVSSIGGSFGSLDYCNNITARNCTDAAFKVTGTGAQFSKVLSLTGCSALVTLGFPFVMSVGFECDLGAVLSSSGSTASGFLSGGGFLDTALFCHNDFSYMDLENTKISSVNIGMNIGTGVSSNNNDEYAFARVQDCTVGFFTTTGLILNLKSSVELFGFLLQDDSGIFPNQNDVVIFNPSSPADPNKYFVFGSTFQRQRIIFAGDPTNPFITAGVVSDITEGRSRTTILGDITLDQAGSDFSMGQGVGNTTAMLIIEDNGGVFTDITKCLSRDNPNPFLCDLATTGVIDLASAPATVDGVAPTLGVSRVLVKDGSTANPGITSIDNGIYIWNGTGAAMTRASDFPIGLVETHHIHFAIDLGTINYGSRWSPDPSTYPAGTFTVGTNAWGVEGSSKSMFPTTFVNDDAFYIGNVAFRLFPGVELAVTAPLTTSSGTSVDVIVWEFFNGVSWETQSLMSTNVVSPYESFANETVGFGQTFLQYETKKYNYRFGDQSGWIPTAVNGVSAYWIRARIIDAANITQIPIIESVNLGTNSTKVNKVGFEEYFGEGRSRKKISIDTKSMSLTGVGNPNNQNLLAAIDGADNVQLNIRDNIFTSNADIGLGHLFVLPTNIDTSFTMRMTVYFIQTAAGMGDIAFKVNYVLTDDNSIINPSGTPNTQLKTTDIVLTTVTGTAGQQQRGVFELDISNYIAGQNVFWFNFFRISSDVGDTYASNINVIVFEIDYVIWNNGKDLQL